MSIMKKYRNYIILVLFLTTLLITFCFIPISASKLIPIVESQIMAEYGVQAHLEKLILRVGPLVKIKAPVIHLTYDDGQKFAQIDSAKFYITWGSILKKSPLIKKMYANKLTLRLVSDDKNLEALMHKLNNKDIVSTPNLYIRDYKFSYLNKENNDLYSLSGHNLDLKRIVGYKSYKLLTKGFFEINNKAYINYDISLEPKFDLNQYSTKLDIINIINQLKNLDFYSDLVTDIKLYKDNTNSLLASGFINIDNISILENDKRNPKSFIYLTLWGDKASVLSNIYTSINKKVYIEGMINNSKKPILDLKVKTDEIAIDELYKKLKVLTCFSRFRNIDSLNGTLNANFTIKGDLNKIKSNGYFKISNGAIRANGLQIDKINSDIDFSNNAINIVTATGYVKDSPIYAKGSIDKNIDIELLMNKVELKYLCPKTLGITNGIASVVANISGTFDNIIHKENLCIENLKLSKNNHDIAIDSIKFDTNKNSTAYISNIIYNNEFTEVIKAPSLKMIIQDDSIKIPETNIFMPNSKLTLKANITDFDSNNITFNSSLEGFINSKDIKTFNPYSSRYPLKLIINGNRLVQNYNSQVLIENTAFFDEPTLVNLSSKFEKNSLKLDDLSLWSFSGKFNNDLKSNLKNQKRIAISGTIENLADPILKNIRLFLPQSLNINIFDTLAQLKGDIFINGKPNKPEIVGQISLQNLFNQLTQLSLSNCTMDFNKTSLTINAPLIKISDSSLAATANISTDISNGILFNNLNIRSKYLNTDTLLMYKDTPLAKPFPIKINDGKFYSERILANIYGEPLYLSAFSGDLKLNNNIVQLKNLAAELFNGKIAGNIEYNLKDEHFNSNIMARGVSAAPIFDIISTRKDSISGIMDFDTNIRGELTSKRSLNGNIKFVVNNGRMSTLGKLEHLLYAQNVIADNMLRTSLSVVTKAITLKDTGLFKYLRGDVDLSEGIAEIKMLQSQGPLMSLFIKGLYNPITDYANLIVLGRLSDEVISGLGAFGDFSLNKLMVMLTGEDPKLNVLPEDFEKIPQLSMKNTKEFRSVINGIIDKTSSVISFNWISYSQKTLKQKEVPMTDIKVPDFVNELPY